MGDRKIVLMSFGLGGNAYYIEGGQSTGSWYLKPEELEAYVDRGDGWGYKSRELEGAVLLDIRPVVELEPGLAFSAPMLDVSLERGTVDRFAERHGGDPVSGMVLEAFASSGGVGATLAGLAARALVDDSFGGLDRVAPDLFVAWWHARGARVGRFVDGRALWQ